MLRPAGSPLASVNAFALATATLLTGAWESSGHSHDSLGANAVHCVVDHEAEASDPAGRTTLNQTAAPHNHSCVARPLDFSSAAAGAENDGSARRGAPRQQAARGPPSG